MVSARACGGAGARRGAAAAGARRRLGRGLKGDVGRESGAGTTRTPRRGGVGLRRVMAAADADWTQMGSLAGSWLGRRVGPGRQGC
jgi:hypothetical protein